VPGSAGSAFERWLPDLDARYTGELLVLAATYYLAAKLSLHASLVGGVVTPIWPPTGIALVAFLIFGVRLWPAITVAAFCVNVTLTSSIGVAGLIALGNTASPLLAAGLLRLAGFRPQLDRLRDALSLVFLGALLAMTVSATLGATALLVDDKISSASYASTWTLWWAGDGTGVLVFAPLLFSLGRLRDLRWRQYGEVVLLVAALAATSYLVFNDQSKDSYVVFPLLILIAMRFRQIGAALGALTLVAIAVWTATDERGPFANVSFLHRMVTLQIYDAVIALTSFVLAAVMAERASAVEGLRSALRREHSIAETLQRSLLPDRLPDVPGLAFASRYRPGGARLDVGGDWYDVMTLPGGRIALTVGDVVGRGLTAAAAMGQLRTALRAYALEDSSPAAVVDRMSRLAGDVEAAQLATLVYAVLDPAACTLTFAVAGHLPPLLVRPGGAAEFLEEARSLPLGMMSTARPEAVVSLEPGSSLVLYTDGLVERRDRSIEDGLSALHDSVADFDGADLDALCDERILPFMAPAENDDDIALLVVQLLPLSADRLRISLPAEAAQLGAVRRTVRSWLGQWHANERDIDDLVLATGEAASNVVEHAYGPNGGVLEIEATHDEGSFTVVVRDQGTWRAARDQDRGRGLTLMRQLVDDVDVVTTATGTEVHLRRDITVPPGRHGEAHVPLPHMRAVDSAAPVPVIRLDGDIDLANATELYHEIIAEVGPDALGLVIDLTDVTHLDSAGLRMLYRIASRLAPRRQTLVLVASQASAVRRMLALAGFERTASLAATVDDAVAELRTASPLEAI
jgi:anti-anti-sigma factor